MMAFKSANPPMSMKHTSNTILSPHPANTQTSCGSKGCSCTCIMNNTDAITIAITVSFDPASYQAGGR